MSPELHGEVLGWRFIAKAHPASYFLELVALKLEGLLQGADALKATATPPAEPQEAGAR